LSVNSLDIAAICSKVEELVFKLRGRLPVDVLTDQVHKFVGVLNRSWHSHGAWPVEVHVCEFVGELLDVGGLHLGNLSSIGSGLTPKFTEHDEVGRRHGALRNHLWHQEEVLVLESGDSVVQDGSAGRVVIRGSSGLVIDPGVDPLLDNHESEPWVVIIRQHLVKFASSSRAATAHVSESSDELLCFVFLRHLQLSVSYTVAEDDDVFGPSVVHLPVLDQTIDESSLQSVHNLLTLTLEDGS